MLEVVDLSQQRGCLELSLPDSVEPAAYQNGEDGNEPYSDGVVVVHVLVWNLDERRRV